jgi:SHS2 domain-containing protein
MYEFFEHTADLGLRIRAADLNMLFVEAAQAMFSAIVEDLGTIKPVREVIVQITGDELDLLLFDWLKQLLYYFDAEHLLLSKFSVAVSETGLLGTAWGEPLDRSRHELEHEVKAITYHGLLVEQTDDGWLAEVIVDI